MSEVSLWASTRRNLAPFGKLERIENLLGKGFPDVLYCLAAHRKAAAQTGFLELKFVEREPAPDNKLVIDSLQLEQVIWAEDWNASGGAIHMLLQVGRRYLLLPPVAFRPIFKHQWTYHKAKRTALLEAYAELRYMRLGPWLSKRLQTET